MATNWVKLMKLLQDAPVLLAATAQVRESGSVCVCVRACGAESGRALNAAQHITAHEAGCELVMLGRCGATREHLSFTHRHVTTLWPPTLISTHTLMSHTLACLAHPQHHKHPKGVCSWHAQQGAGQPDAHSSTCHAGGAAARHPAAPEHLQQTAGL